MKTFGELFTGDAVKDVEGNPYTLSHIDELDRNKACYYFDGKSKTSSFYMVRMNYEPLENDGLVYDDFDDIVECRHEYVNVGFFTVKLVCKRCDREKSHA